MPSSRRQFLAVSSVGSAAWLAGAGAAAAAPKGARKPAPGASPPYDDQAAQALARSPVVSDEDLARRAVEAAVAAGATYADARLVLLRREHVQVRDDRSQPVRLHERYGLGVRALAEGGWGFAATQVLSARAVTEAAQRAVATARHSGTLRQDLGQPPVELVAAPAVQGQWVTPHEIDPFDVAPVDKAQLLLELTAAARRVPGVAYADASLQAVAEDKLLVTSDGARIHQILLRVAPELTATAVDRRRGGFASRSHEAPAMLAGWEYVRDLGLLAQAEGIGEDAVRKLHAASVEPGPTTVVLAPSNLWLTIHESIGHPTELDRVMGLEADFAGTSFLRPDDAGTRKIGSEKVHLVADRTQPGGLATVGWDDEGVAAQRWDLVREGVLVGWQTTRDQAAWVGETASRGCLYGEGHDGVPFQRMPNISLQPGPEGYTTEDLINATEDGIYITGRGSGSIDQQRRNFQFSGQMCWEIKRGRLRRPLRDVAYQGQTTDFWGSCDMIGGKGTYRLGGTYHDGKGQPVQSNAVSHGCPPARFSATIVNTEGADR
ncbi:MAG: TldD/PmbA family protein [Myxococcales bacterium]|nr:TldD/PmbA family protein [Myxococcales bacterium]